MFVSTMIIWLYGKPTTADESVCPFPLPISYDLSSSNLQWVTQIKANEVGQKLAGKSRRLPNDID